MKRYFISGVVVAIAFIQSLFAQSDTTNGKITGKLVNMEGQPLVAATVSLLNAKDSSIVTKIISADSGRFQFDKVKLGSYLVEITYQGYDTAYKSAVLTDRNYNIDFTVVHLKANAYTLGTVVVEASPPMVMKKDTMEFNAGSFTTKPNAVVEDLLKKIPGMEVDKDGTVKAQGEQVARVLVDGKRFFGDDPKLATQNLPPDIVDKIQVFDALSDQSAFSGFDDGNRVKTINIVTKRDKRQGYFGKVVGGIGDKDLYTAGVALNKFNNGQQISIIAQANNTNKQNFTRSDLSNAGFGGGGRGGRGGMGGGGSSGLTKTYAGGINYKDNWGTKTEVSGSYFYNNLQVENEQNVATKNLLSSSKQGTLPYNSTLVNQNTASLSKNPNQRFNFNIETNFDSLNALIIRPNASYNNTRSTSSTESTTKGLTDKNDTLNLNSNTARQSREGDSYNASVDILYRHRFLKKGRTVSTGISLGGNNNNTNGSNWSEVHDYQTGKDSITNQQYDSKSNGNNFSATLSYTEPIGKNQQIELNYNFSRNYSLSKRNTYNYDPSSKNYSELDSLLTNHYENTYYSNRFTLSYKIQTENMNLNFGSGVQIGIRNSINQTKNYDITQNYVNMSPTANFRYRFSKTKDIRFNYDGRTNQPSISQLQPLEDNSDQLNLTSGNPQLGQSFNNNFRLFYKSFDNNTTKNFMIMVNGSFTNNAIVNATFTNDSILRSTFPNVLKDTSMVIANGGQFSIPVNANGYYNVSAYINYGFPLKTPKSNLNFGADLSHSQTVSYSNNVKNFNRNYGLGGTIKWTTNLKDNFDMNLSYKPSYNIATYSINSSQNGNYFSQTLSTDATYYTKSGWVLSSDFNYTYLGGRGDYNTSIPLWNASIAKLLFKKQQGELKFSVFDLLNQNVSVSRITTDNYIRDVKTKVLTRYCLLTFTYNIRNFGSQQNKMPGFFRGEGGEPREPRGDRGGGGGFRSGGGGPGGPPPGI